MSKAPPRDYPEAWAQLYTWLGYHTGAAVSADGVRSQMRHLTRYLGAPPPGLDPRQRAAGEHLDNA